MFRYANPYDFEPRVAEGDQVGGMVIVLDVSDDFEMWSRCGNWELALSSKVKHLPVMSLTYFFCIACKDMYTILEEMKMIAVSSTVRYFKCNKKFTPNVISTINAIKKITQNVISTVNVITKIHQM